MEFHFQSPPPFQHTPKVLKSPKPKGQRPKAVPCGGGGTGAAAAKFVGVRQRPSGRWVAEIKDTTQKIRMWLGTFETAEEAAHAYDEAACLIRGANTRTNFGANPVSAANSPLALRIRNLLNSRSKPGKPRRPAPPTPPPPFSTTVFLSGAIAGNKISQAIGSLEGASGYMSCRPQFSTSDANQSNVGVSDLAQFPTDTRWVMDPSGIEPVLYVPSDQNLVQEMNFGSVGTQMGAYMNDINEDYGGGNAMVHDHVSEGIWDLHSHLFSCQS